MVALVNDPARLPEYQSLDVNAFATIMYRPALLARSPDIFKPITSPTDDQDVREVCMENPQVAGQRLGALDLPGNLLALAISRDGEIFIPHGGIRLQLRDRLTLLGNISEVEEFTHWLETN